MVLEFSDEDNAEALERLVDEDVEMLGSTPGTLPITKDLTGQQISSDEEHYLGHDERKIKTRYSAVVNAVGKSNAKLSLRKRKKAICIHEPTPMPVANTNELRLNMVLIDYRSDSMLANTSSVFGMHRPWATPLRLQSCT
jgi:hypothetical protein